ncbi:tail completion or Neck1 protein [Stenotrophomonas phage vB_SmaS_Bhz59]
MARIALGTQQNADRLTRTVALAADQAVVVSTPVDTGRAKSNWIVELGSAPSDTIEPYAEGEFGSTAAENEQAALQQGESVIAGYNGDLNVDIHITNNLPYIEELNAGSSYQAPANFVEIALVEALSIIRGGTIKLTGSTSGVRFFNLGRFG